MSSLEQRLHDDLTAAIRSRDEVRSSTLRMALTADGRARLQQGKRHADRVERRLLAGMDASTEGQVRRWLVQVATARLGGP